MNYHCFVPEYLILEAFPDVLCFTLTAQARKYVPQMGDFCTFVLYLLSAAIIPQQIPATLQTMSPQAGQLLQ